MNEYTIGLDNPADETSVDAQTETEAIDTALDLFKEFHPDLTEESIKANMKVREVRPLSADEEQEITGEECGNCGAKMYLQETHCSKCGYPVDAEEQAKFTGVEPKICTTTKCPYKSPFCPTCGFYKTNHAEAFRRFVKEQQPSMDEEEIKAVWFEENDGCYPSAYISEELLSDIHTKFYYPLAYLRHLIKEKHPRYKKESLLIAVDPDYMNNTTAVLHVKDTILLREVDRAWHYYWETDYEFNDWVATGVEIIESKLPIDFPLFIIAYAQSNSEQGFLIQSESLDSAKKWADKWETNANNLDYEVELTSVKQINSLNDLKCHPAIFVDTTGEEK